MNKFSRALALHTEPKFLYLNNHQDPSALLQLRLLVCLKYHGQVVSMPSFSLLGIHRSRPVYHSYSHIAIFHTLSILQVPFLHQRNSLKGILVCDLLSVNWLSNFLDIGHLVSRMLLFLFMNISQESIQSNYLLSLYSLQDQHVLHAFEGGLHFYGLLA